MHKGRYLAFRSILDRLTAAILLIVLSPVFAAVSLAVIISMGKPVLFRQKRVGQHGRVFVILKFRTMIANAEQLGGGAMPPELNLIPPLGRFLRRTSLDEIPQLVNILRGDMAFIGPRPALVDQYLRYTPEQAGRVLVPQGVTGLAQVRYRNNAPWSLRIKTDLEYVHSLSPAFDCRILLSTVVNVLRSEGVRWDQKLEEIDDLPARRDSDREISHE